MDYASSSNFVIGEQYPITPEMIDTTHHFFKAFGKQEAEVSANWIVRFCKDRGGWKPFIKESLDAYAKEDFWFNGLDKEFIIKQDGLYYITHEFVCRCFLWSPVTPPPVQPGAGEKEE